MKIPDFCIERWVAYAVAVVLVVAASFDDDVSGSERLWAYVATGVAVVLAEGFASAITRHGRSRQVTGAVVEGGPVRTSTGRGGVDLP